MGKAPAVSLQTQRSRERYQHYFKKLASIPDEKLRELDQPILPSVRFRKCPIQASLGVLGKKWTMLIIRNIGFGKIDRFNRILEITPGLTPRVLSMRLRELEKQGFINWSESRNSPKVVRWALTEKGKDVLPILMRFTAFGAKWYPDLVFEDKTPRTLTELFTQAEAKQIIKGYT
jgi:DNA-binding HxlR family transcriptional regulator